MKLSSIIAAAASLGSCLADIDPIVIKVLTCYLVLASLTDKGSKFFYANNDTQL